MLAAIVWNVGTISVFGTFAVALAGVVGGLWYAIERARSTNDLKRRMVERGMTVEEIERVMAASDPKQK